jgi:hypothetical protein
LIFQKKIQGKHTGTCQAMLSLCSRSFQLLLPTELLLAPLHAVVLPCHPVFDVERAPGADAPPVLTDAVKAHPEQAEEGLAALLRAGSEARAGRTDAVPLLFVVSLPPLLFSYGEELSHPVLEGLHGTTPLRKNGEGDISS